MPEDKIEKYVNTLALITKVIKAGGELVPIALQAFEELRSESGLTSDALLLDTERITGESVADLARLIEKAKV